MAVVLSSETALRATQMYLPESLVRTLLIESVEETGVEYISTLSAFPSRTPFLLHEKETSSPSTAEHEKRTDFPARIRFVGRGSNRTDSATKNYRMKRLPDVEFQASTH